MKVAFSCVCFILISFSMGNNIVCPGGSRQCKDTATCCQLPDGSYGCCPLSHAVCCPDKIHCCPSGSRCEGDECFKLNFNSSASFSTVNEHSHICHGNEHFCPKNSTCCKHSENDIYSCCMSPNAVCCSDGESCCPHSFVCDLENKSCVKKGQHLTRTSLVEMNNIFDSDILTFHSSDMYNKKRPNYVICPGSKYKCPDYYTCCQRPGEIVGCCPFPNAVCCQDFLHCCPHGLKCGPSSETCYQGGKNMTSLQLDVSNEIL